MSTKGFLGCCLDLELLINLVSGVNHSNSKQIPKHPCVDIGKWKMCTKFQEKL